MISMKALVARSPVGLFAFTESGEVICYSKFTPEESANLKNVPQAMAVTLSGYEIEENHVAYAFLRRRFRELAAGLAGKSEDEINRDVVKFAAAFSRQNLVSSISRDRLVIQAVNALEDLKKVLNLYNERIYEWFSLHYPEMKKRSPETIAEYGRRENFPGFKASFGVPLTENDEKTLRSFAEMIMRTEKELSSLEKYVFASIEEIMPTTSTIIEPTLAARLLAHAGSMDRLAKMPASTIQLLGAEKALFRHLKKKGKSPKFGILFSDRRIQEAPKEKQGKAARFIASKIMMAVRIDFYSKRKDAKLRESLDKEMEKI